MNFILSIFWNRPHHRLRALWRLILMVLLLVIFTGLSQLLLTGLVRLPFDFLANRTFQMIISVLGVLLATIASVALAGRFLDHRPFRDFGFRFSPRWWADFGFGLALGAVLMTLIFLVELAAGWLQVTGFQAVTHPLFPTVMLFPIILFICVGIQEELTTRGYLLRNLAEGFHGSRISPRAALLAAYLLSSILFGLLHAANPNATVVSTLNVMLAGLFLGLPFVLSGELAMSIGIHITWNFFQGNVYGFPVSGTNSGLSLIAIQQGGPLWATGGAFGPEAGLIGLLAIALGSLLIYAYLRRRTPSGLQEHLAVYQPSHPQPPAEADPISS